MTHEEMEKIIMQQQQEINLLKSEIKDIKRKTDRSIIPVYDEHGIGVAFDTPLGIFKS
jgi:hypothetical protein